ncbi:phosphoribosylglycinamide formyltransferase [Paraferrimonas sp. SM1919]|uniref:phosphoribosylglycinamide formyltransferase n=1 Tax=Paraferrimonas sp. SM1919 TaxID=2662263 RepID=UPI0013D019BB|nr:phosphoribosylglycinamide formyltransferase [Paraferrimonas sp. SM1919]
MTKRLVVLISGNGSNLQAIIDSSCNDDVAGRIVGVISNRADAYGLERAKSDEIDAISLPAIADETRSDYDKRLAAEIDKLNPDLIILAGFMRILTPEFVAKYQGKMINIHPSLLPKYPGLNTHARAIENNDDTHGASVHFVTAEVDGGPVILQGKVPVFADDDIATLQERVHDQEHRIYPMVVQWFIDGRLIMQADKAILDGQVLPENGYASE